MQTIATFKVEGTNAFADLTRNADGTYNAGGAYADGVGLAFVEGTTRDHAIAAMLVHIANLCK